MEAGFYSQHDIVRNPAFQARLQERRQQEQRHDRRLSGSDTSVRIPSISKTVSRSPQLSRTTSGADTQFSQSSHTKYGSMSRTSSLSQSVDENNADLLANPYELRYGRRYLRTEIPYALPCDLAEIHRQSLRTLVGVTAFSKPACAPSVVKRPPRRVLEIGCGSAYWSSSCHAYFKSLGRHDVSFTGVDIAPLAPDLRRQGIDWEFVQHDIRRMPWPFGDEEFDYVMIKDMSLAVPLGAPWQSFLDESIRVLSEWGTLEVWESDHVLRSVSQAPLCPIPTDREHEAIARDTKTFLLTPGMLLPQAQDKYIQESNFWISQALAKRKLPATPCARMAEVLYQESEELCDVGWRRVAIPFKELPCEKYQARGRNDSHSSSVKSDSHLTSRKLRAKSTDSSLTADQAALRYTAMLIILQKIESLEPLLKEASGKNTEEWAAWWLSMSSSMLEGDGASNGECLEIGSWWATKRTR